jgi:RNA polymerase sigma-B factor
VSIDAMDTSGSARATRDAETNRLLSRARGADPAERQGLVDEVVMRTMPVAKSVASRYRDRGVPIEDLEQVACLALVRAANRFDPDKAADFLAYAVPTIRGELKRYFRDHGWSVRPPRRIQEVQALINRSDVVRTDGSVSTPRAIAEQLGIDECEVRDALEAKGCFAPTSLDSPTYDGGEPLGHSLVDDDYAEHEAVEARVILRTLTRELKPRERLVLYLRFVEGRTQAEIGAEIGVTQMQVSRILAQTLHEMRERLTGTASEHVA